MCSNLNPLSYIDIISCNNTGYSIWSNKVDIKITYNRGRCIAETNFKIYFINFLNSKVFLVYPIIGTISAVKLRVRTNHKKWPAITATTWTDYQYQEIQLTSLLYTRKVLRYFLPDHTSVYTFQYHAGKYSRISA